MNILISGGSGFLGSALTQNLINNPINGEQTTITWLSRSAQTRHPDNVQILTYDDLKTTSQAFDIIINLAGAGIADKRWTAKRQIELIDSRMRPTEIILDNYIKRVEQKPKLFISGSAIGWYGAFESTEVNTPLDETSENHFNDFPHKLCLLWEKLATFAQYEGVPTVIIRTGIVLDPKGGMLTRLLTPFKLGLGGKLGDGRQVMSWISRTDWVQAVRFIIEQSIPHLASPSGGGTPLPQGGVGGGLRGVQIYNLTHPNPVTNAEFTKALGQWLHRPTWFTVPKFVLKLLLGEMATLLVDGQKVLPNNLLNQGFKFHHNTVLEALESQ